MSQEEKTGFQQLYARYTALGEDELIVLAKAGDIDAEEIIIKRYKDVVKNRTAIYFIAGADKEDIVQEGMIGVFKAIRDYDAGKGASFRTFAEMCITRQIITAIKSATRKKHAPLNSYVSISTDSSDEENTIQLDNILATSSEDPEAKYLLKEELDYIWTNFSKIFSGLEWAVWTDFLAGKTMHEIADSQQKSIKSIDNALQRGKKKIEAFLAK